MAQPSIFDKLVGLAMLVAASVVFLYYTIWTLLMVRGHIFSTDLCWKLTTGFLALRRFGSSSPKHLPSASLGYSHPRHSYSPGIGRSGLIFECGYD